VAGLAQAVPMTPLAYRIIKDMTLPIKRRTFHDAGKLLPHFRNEFHCFELTHVREFAQNLLFEILDAAFPSVAWSFLPAERTWLECKDKNGDRLGYMLLRQGEWAQVYVANCSADAFGAHYVGRIALSDALLKIGPLGWNTIESSIFQDIAPELTARTTFVLAGRKLSPLAALWTLYSYLILINTPRVIGRTTHDPHRGLAREILSRRKTLGIFPLQAWTEILLPIDTINVRETEEASGLTGAKCLHWTRAHKKRVHGIWTLISDYWSGDGSLGIKQSRYKLVPSVGRRIR
jgi:hypothetical protein